MTTAPTVPVPRGDEGRGHHPGRKRRLAIAVAILAVVGVAFFAGWLPRRLAQSRAVRQATAQLAPPRVAVVPAAAQGTGRDLTVPGGLVAAQRTLVYARASGYVRTWLVDIGDHVRTDQVLAVLDTPDLDQQLAQARASLSQRKAALVQATSSYQYARLTAERTAVLYAQNLIAKQDDDQARTQVSVWDASVAAAQADVRAQQGAVRQLEDLVAYARVTAPYEGTVTSRLVEVGSLVNAGAGSSVQALFEIEKTDPMRVFVRVPQTFAPSIRAGESADVTVRQYPGRKFAGTVTRTAGALDPASRTLSTEVVIPNPSGELLPGMYCEVSLAVSVSHFVVRVPASAVIFDASGLHVAIVDATSRVHLVTVLPGRNFGNEVEIVEGLQGNEPVISAPPADVTEGMPVQVAAP